MSTIIGGKDRTDYRVMSTRALIEESKYYPTIELCIAIGERLEKKQRVECPECDYQFTA